MVKKSEKKANAKKLAEVFVAEDLVPELDVAMPPETPHVPAKAMAVALPPEMHSVLTTAMAVATAKVMGSAPETATATATA